MNETMELEAGLLQTSLSSVRFNAVAQIAHTLVPTRLEDKLELRLPEISLKEVAMHDHSADCWIVIYDRVYDVTNFLILHPGGHDVILEYAGRDASFAFRGTGHSKYAINSLKTYEIGELPLNERIFRCGGKLLIGDLPN